MRPTALIRIETGPCRVHTSATHRSAPSGSSRSQVTTSIAASDANAASAAASRSSAMTRHPRSRRPSAIGLPNDPAAPVTIAVLSWRFGICLGTGLAHTLQHALWREHASAGQYSPNFADVGHGHDFVLRQLDLESLLDGHDEFDMGQGIPGIDLVDAQLGSNPISRHTKNIRND